MPDLPVVREIDLLSPVAPVVIVLTHLLSVRKLPVLVFDVFLVSSSLTLCWMCGSSVCFMCSSRSAFGFSQVVLFFLLPAVGDALLQYSKNNDYGKGNEKGKERGKKSKGKGQGKDEKPAPNSSFQVYCRSCGKWGHKASECWQGYAQAVEEVPISSASSVAPSATTTPAATKTAASIQEFNDEQEPGWIFGVMGESVASVTTGTDDLWDELVLDSGSVSTACPYAWCSDISVNNEDKVYLQDIQQRRIPSHGSRVVPLELWCAEGRVECKVKFDVADVAYPLVSLGKMIESSFTFRFDDYKCYMHKGNQRVQIFRKGRMFVLRMRRRWLESKVQMVAPIDEVAEEEMEIVDDGERAGGARTEPRTDEPGDGPPPPRPRRSIRPGAEAVRLHNKKHCPYQKLVRSVCGIEKQK